MELFSSIGETWQTWAVNPLSEVLNIIRDRRWQLCHRHHPVHHRDSHPDGPAHRQADSLPAAHAGAAARDAEIRRKYRNDRQAQSQATMKLYKEHGVSPLSGCLPIFVQLPICSRFTAAS